MLSEKLLVSFMGFFVLFGFLLVTPVFGSSIMWSKTYGSGYWERATDILQTSDGGYVIVGYAPTEGAGNNDYWLIKTDENGNEQWNKTYGGIHDDHASAVIQTQDQGFVIVGPWLLVKTDENGTMMWNQTLLSGDAKAVLETHDGGYAIAGGHRLVKTNSEGNQVWEKIYELSAIDSFVQTPDNGFALAGVIGSPIDDSYDFWLAKTDENGTLEWSKNYGGYEFDYAFTVVLTSDGGFALSGVTWSFGAGSNNFWLVKTDSEGNMLWNQTYGGESDEQPYSMIQTNDNGYAIAGYTVSYGSGSSDFWLIKTDSNGNPLWNQTYGGYNWDVARSVIETDDGGYALTGETGSFGSGNFDFWIIKTNQQGIIPEFPIWTVLPLFIIGVLAVLIFKKKL